MKKYNLTVSENQAQIIAKACDMLARIHIGNVECVADEFMTRRDYLEIREILVGIHERITGSCCGGPSISNPTVHHDGKAAWDICQAIKHRLTHDCKVPATYSVYYQKPLQCGSEEIPTISAVDDPNTVQVGKNETLYEFRQRSPFKPYEIALIKPPTDPSIRDQLVRTDPTWAAWLLSLNDESTKQVEIMSWPYNYDHDHGEVVINVRLVPGDSTTMGRADIKMLVKQ